MIIVYGSKGEYTVHIDYIHPVQLKKINYIFNYMEFLLYNPFTLLYPPIPSYTLLYPSNSYSVAAGEFADKGTYDDWEYMNIILNLDLALDCSAWICTLKSNYCQLIDEVRVCVIVCVCV